MFNYLMHYGVGHDKGGNSGRYPWGSGEKAKQTLKENKQNRKRFFYKESKYGAKKVAKKAKKGTKKAVKNENLTKEEKKQKINEAYEKALVEVLDMPAKDFYTKYASLVEVKKINSYGINDARSAMRKANRRKISAQNNPNYGYKTKNK